MLNDLDRRTLCCHAGVYITLEFSPSKCPPLAPVYLDVEHTLSVGAAMVMVPKQRRLVPLARTNFVGQHPVRMKQSWLNCGLPNKQVATLTELLAHRRNWAGHAVNNRSRYMF